MTKSGLPYKSRSPSNAPPSNQFYNKKQELLGDNLAENDSKYFENKDSNVNNIVNSKDFELKNCKFIHNRNKFNVVPRTHDSSNTLNVVDSKLISETSKVDKFTNIVNEYKDSNQYVNNFHLIRSKFEPNNNINNINNKNNSIVNNNKYINSNEKLKEVLKLSRENLNTVKEFKKDVPTSRLPIMYQDDVEALLSRKPNSVRNFVNSLNKQLNNISNKTGDYKFKFGSYESKYPNQNNYCKSTNPKNENKHNKFDLKLEDLNLKLESLGKDGLFGHFDEFRDFVNFEKYISNNHKFHLNGHKLFDDNTSNKQEDKDNMLTYRSNTFGNFSFMSPVADCTKSTSDLCNNSSRDGFLVDKNNNNFSVNQYTNNSFNLNFKTNFDNYFNNNNLLNNETFKRSKLSSRSNMTRINTDRSVRDDLNVTDGIYYKSNEGYYNIENQDQDKVGKLDTQPNKLNFEDKNTISQRKATLGDLIFSKRFMQSINTLPEGVNLVIDTPRSESRSTQGYLRTSKRYKNDENIFINSVNLIKAGWVWVQSSKTREWVPKFMVLFYDDEVSPKNYYTQIIPNYTKSTSNNRLEYLNNYRSNNTSNYSNNDNNSNNNSIYNGNYNNGNRATTQFGQMNNEQRDYNRYFQGDIVKSNDGFWGIYQVYTQLNPNLHPAISNSKFSSPLSSNSTSNNLKFKYDETLIRDNSAVYLCLLNHEPPDYYDCITNRNYLQLYRVDTSTTPYLRSFNSCWLTRFIARRMKTNLELIIIPLEDDYECCFAPLCAAKLNPEVNFSYEMELACKNKVNQEYDQWMFKLWEYSLRTTNQLQMSTFTNSTELVRLDGAIIPNVTNHSDNSSEPATREEELSVDNNPGFFTKCYKYLCSFFGISSDDGIVDERVVDKSRLRTRIIESINNTREQQSPTIRSSSDDGLSKDENVECENMPSPQNFINWIDKYGFDDLSIKMNMYTLVNRV